MIFIMKKISSKTKIKKSHFEAIYSNYEKARNQKDF